MTTDPNATSEGKILILATETCAYPGADSVGQAHSSYPANTYIMRVRAPVLFPEQFYLDCFKKGISGIIISSTKVIKSLTWNPKLDPRRVKSTSGVMIRAPR